MSKFQLFNGDCIEMMDKIEDNSVDIILTDPPYSSGGLNLKDRQRSTKEKYTDTNYNGASRLPDFTGDNMDAHSYMNFIRSVFYKARQTTKNGGVIMTFIDWRNLPLVIDGLQMAGWVWRGIVPWDKGNSRPIPGRFRNDCEYVVWGENGLNSIKAEKGCFVGKGCFHVSSIIPKNKKHQTEKPVELLEKLLEIKGEGATVLDPFAGSGSTGEACFNQRKNFIGIELNDEYFLTMKERLEKLKEKDEELVIE